MNRYFIVFLIVANSWFYTAEAQKKAEHFTPQQNLEGLFNPKIKRVLVSAHRGDWRNAPEHSLIGLKNCVDMGG